ncbi:hypothetical protein V2J09_019389 [Rumex salicifolius]
MAGRVQRMMKKAPIAPPLKVLWLVLAISILLCIVVLWKLNSDPEVDYPLNPVRSARRSRSAAGHFQGSPKIAFLFLARRDLPLDFLWGSFFEAADKESYSIYIHSEPGFVFDESTTRCPLFYGRQVSNSIKVGWGEASMIQAERLLFDVALDDPGNQRFVLLSDSCIPLYNFSYVYDYLVASQRSFVDSFHDKGDQYNPKMSPKIPREKWRKGSQWIAVTRKHAEIVVDDEKVFPVFRKFCKRRPPLDLNQKKRSLKLQKQHNCIPDEHYVQTLLAMKELEDELERRTVTYTLWNESAARMEKKGWHPVTFSYTAANPKRILEIKNINHVYYETEFRTEWCRTNFTYVPCFLFARKFTRGAAMRLLGDELFGNEDYSTLPENTQD